MIAGPGIDCETWLVCFVGDGKSDEFTNHHHGATHEVIHHIFESWHQRFLAHQEEEYFFICDNLESYVSSDEVDLSSHIVNSVVLFPKISLFVDSEEQN